MLLSGKEIKRLLSEKTTETKKSVWQSNKPIEQLKFGPNSVDVTLSKHFWVAKTLESSDTVLDLEKIDSKVLFEEVETNELILPPNHLVLGSVNEWFDCANAREIVNENGNLIKQYFVQHYEGRSTMGRVGIQSHITAGFGDYGFKGAFTLEIINNSPWTIKLKEGMRIGQVFFTQLDGELEAYDGYLQTDCKPQLPRLGKGRF